MWPFFAGGSDLDPADESSSAFEEDQHGGVRPGDCGLDEQTGSSRTSEATLDLFLDEVGVSASLGPDAMAFLVLEPDEDGVVVVGVCEFRSDRRSGTSGIASAAADFLLVISYFGIRKTRVFEVFVRSVCKRESTYFRAIHLP